jgi:hypothetical protein
MATVPLARWRPDVAALNSQFASDVVNVLCAATDYIPFPKLEPFSQAVPAQPTGAFSARNSTGQIVIFVGTASKIYQLNGTTLAWDHVSRLAADIAVNGTFATDTVWGKSGASVTISAGKAHFTASPTNEYLVETIAPTVGTTYKIVYTVSGYSAGGVTLTLTGGTTVSGTLRSANGTYTEYLTAATGNIGLAFIVTGTTTLDIDDVTMQGLAIYASTVDERWQFEQFGDYVVAVNINDNPQVFEIGVSTNFADLAGSPPRARYIKAWGDFLALMNLSGNENRVHWSALNDITGWTPGTNNSDYQDFPDGGVVQGSSSATNPFVILKRAIYAGTFVPGSVEIFTFTKIHEDRGAAAPYSIASRGSFTIFADSGGLFQLNSDGSVIPIGFEKIDRTVFGRITGPDLTALFAEIDPFFNRYYLAVRYTAPQDAFDKIIIYDWGVGEFTQIDMTQDVLFPLASGTLGYTLEGLSAISSSLDALPFSLDSKVWQGGAPVMAALDVDHKLGFYSGPNAEAIITTQEAGAVDGMVTRLHEILPAIDTHSFRVSIGARMRRSDAVVWSPYRGPSSNTGIVRGRSRSRYHMFKLQVLEDAPWTHAQSMDVNSQPAGSR